MYQNLFIDLLHLLNKKAKDLSDDIKMLINIMQMLYITCQPSLNQ